MREGKERERNREEENREGRNLNLDYSITPVCAQINIQMFT